MKRLTFLAAVGLCTAGCYTLQPVVGSGPFLGDQLSLSINDAGRVALGGAIGPEISEIEGRLVQKDSSQYVMSVTLLRLLRGGEQVWSGEKIPVKSAFVSSVQVRRFSRARSVALGAVGVGTVAYMLTRAIIGSGSHENKPGQPSDSANTLRRPWP
jgi:hypothetical protein